MRFLSETNNIFIELNFTGGCLCGSDCQYIGIGDGSVNGLAPSNNCTMQGQNNWANWGSPGVMKLLSCMGGASLTNEVPGVM